MRHNVAFEQSAVARQDNPPFGSGSRGEMRVITIAFVRRVETEEAQMASQPAEMHIRKEPWLTQRFGPHNRDWSDVERLEHRIDSDSIAIAHPIGEINGFAV